MQRIKVLFFGPLVSVTGKKEIFFQLKRGKESVGQVKEELLSMFPGIGQMPCTAVVNHSLCNDDYELRKDDELALLPPVSGGSFNFLTRDMISSDLTEQLKNRDGFINGSILVFEGRIRKDHKRDLLSGNTQFVKAIEYSAYEPMAEKEITEIREMSIKKFGISDAEIRHRLGRVGLGEVAFLVIVFSQHRKEGLRAMDFIIDEVKSKVPVWKKEIYSNGNEVWKQGQLIVQTS